MPVGWLRSLRLHVAAVPASAAAAAALVAFFGWRCRGVARAATRASPRAASRAALTFDFWSSFVIPRTHIAVCV